MCYISTRYWLPRPYERNNTVITKKELQEIYNLVSKDINATDEFGQTALICAAAAGYGYENIVSALIKAGTDLEIQDRIGQTALISAVQHGGRFENVMALIEAGADLDKQQFQGKTALFIALEMGWGEIAEALIEAGADLSKKTNEGQTVLTYRGHYENSNRIAERAASGYYDKDRLEKAIIRKIQKSGKGNVPSKSV